MLKDFIVSATLWCSLILLFLQKGGQYKEWRQWQWSGVLRPAHRMRPLRAVGHLVRTWQQLRCQLRTIHRPSEHDEGGYFLRWGVRKLKRPSTSRPQVRNNPLSVGCVSVPGEGKRNKMMNWYAGHRQGPLDTVIYLLRQKAATYYAHTQKNYKYK